MCSAFGDWKEHRQTAALQECWFDVMREAFSLGTRLGESVGIANDAI